jgi:hypothetical protein
MSMIDTTRRHRVSQARIELDVSFLPDRLPQALRFPLQAAGGPDALIKIDQAEAYLSPASDPANRWQCSLTICPPGEGHFMKVELSITEAKKLLEALDHVINWEEGMNTRAQAAAKPARKAPVQKAEIKKAKAKPVASTKVKAKSPVQEKAMSGKARGGKRQARSTRRS